MPIGDRPFGPKITAFLGIAVLMMLLALIALSGYYIFAPRLDPYVGDT